MERGRRKLIEGVLANSGLQRLVGSYRKDAQATLGPSSCLSSQSFLGHGMPPRPHGGLAGCRPSTLVQTVASGSTFLPSAKDR